jgi:hypothetical protein
VLFLTGNPFLQRRMPQDDGLMVGQSKNTEPGVGDRMPVILPEEFHDRGLDRDLTDKAELQAMLQPFDASRMEANAVSPWVNSPTHDGERCVEAVRAGS